MHFSMRALVVPFTAVFLTIPATADAQRLVRFGIGGGVTVPVGELANVTENGYHGQVMLGVNVPLFPVSLRLDGAFHQLPTGNNGHLRQIAVTANGRIAAIGLPVTPYLIGGAGVYNTRFTHSVTYMDLDLSTEAQTDFGVNAGAGLLLRLGLVQAFVEARYHLIFNDVAVTHVPVTVGFMF
jgi:hypothetical protein